MEPKTAIEHHEESQGNHIYDNLAVEHQLSADRNDMLAPDFSRVLVIYTGGTIGMKHTTEHGYIPLPNYLAQTLAQIQRFHDPQEVRAYSRSPSQSSLDSLDQPDTAAISGGFQNTVRVVQQDDARTIETYRLPSLVTPVSLYEKRIRYSILEYDPLLDSCNMTMDDWVRIACDIEANYQLFDAFIVLHGTDTMAYTASALSFMLQDLGKTVIITGSQVPLTEVRNDAVENLLGALTVAGHFVIPEVCLYFGQKLYRGNRTSKLSAVDFDAFDSPNLPSLVDLGIDINVKWPLVLRPTQIAKFQAHKCLNRNVASLRLFPGINVSTVRSFLAAPIQGVVLETYGAGNAPARPDLLEALKEACDRGVVIVNCTQCRKGLVTDAYATGRQLAKIGVVAGADMTPECALTKLSYLLGRDLPLEEVRSLMRKNLRGELTVRAPQQRFSMPTTRSSAHVLIDLVLNLAETQRDEGSLSFEEQLLAEKALAPLLLCSAAAVGDLNGIERLYGSLGELINLNCVDYEGRSPLHVACREGHTAVIEYLLLHGAAIHVRDRAGHTPLYLAAAGMRSEAVQMLRSAGAHLAESEREDFGPLWLKAVRENHVKFMKIALEAGWPVDWSEPGEGRHALDVAILHGRMAALKVLLGASVNVTLRDRWGFTALEKAKRMKEQGGDRRVSVETIDEMIQLLEAKIARNAAANGSP